MSVDTKSLQWLLAPLAGYTDVPFRLACRRQGCRYAFTPLIDAGALCYGNRKNDVILARDPGEEWLGTQLLGSDPEMMGRAAARLCREPWDCLDINMGCPVRKVMRKGAGAALPFDPENALACVRAVMRQAGGLPVTVKMRVLHDEDPTPTLRFAERLRDEGVCALTLHGRVWERIYSGPVAGGVIRHVREHLDIPVVANGGIFSRADGVALAESTGCERLMVARGAIGNPWIFRELAGTGPRVPTHDEVCEEVRRHVEGMVALYGEECAMRNGRKIILSYLCGRGYRRSLRAEVGGIVCMRDFERIFRVLQAEGPTEGYRPSEDGEPQPEADPKSP